jgi:SAM-dependent methyltransferase
MDLHPPADIVGDIRNWRELGLQEESFDVMIAFETLEHVDCLRQCYLLLKPGGVLLATSPIPARDWIMHLLEWLGLNQKRHAPHEHLLIFEKAPYFEFRGVRLVGGLAQWAILTKATTGYLSEVRPCNA